MHVLERKKDALGAVPCKEGDDPQEHELAQGVPDKCHGVRMVHQGWVETDPGWNCQPRHNHQCRPEQRRQRAASAKHEPEYRGIGSLHCEILPAITSSRSVARATTPIPAVVINRGST